MTDFDRANLDRVLPDVAGTADWADVLRRARSGASRRRRIEVLAAVALVVVIGTASAFGVRAVLHKNGVALPPEGAKASSPPTGLLVAQYVGRPELRGFPSRFVPVHQVWVYADGRVVWRRESGPRNGSDGVRTGFLEQRLTRGGVALLRKRLLSTGLFGRDRRLAGDHGLTWGVLKARRGGRLVQVSWIGGGGIGFPPAYPQPGDHPTRAEATAISRLTELLADIPAHLSGRAWKQPARTAYIASRYAICFWDDTGTPLRPSQAAGSLPRAARALVGGTSKTYRAFPSACSEVTTETARRLEELLADAGWKRGFITPWWTPRLRSGGSDARMQWISFEPVLPHGQWEPMGG